MTIEQVIRVVFDDNAYTRNVAQAASVSGKFDSTVNSVSASLLAMTQSANRAGAAQALAANSGGAFLAALQKQAATLTQQSSVIGKSEADLLRLKAAELGVAQQAGATIAALDEQSRALERRSAGARAVDNLRAVAALSKEQQALEAGIAVDVRAGRAKQDLIAQIERETAALTRLAAVPRGTVSAERGPTGNAVDRVRDVAAADPTFAARAQPALVNLGAAQAARDQQLFIASLERTASAAGRTRGELLALEAAERGVTAQAAPLIARIAAADKQFQSFSKTGRLTALELQQVGFQLNDFFVQVASGQNVLIAGIQQGSQLSGTFGGMGAAVRALTSLITPLTIGIAAAVAAAGGFAIAATKTEQWQRALSDLQATLQGTGRGGQFSNSQLGAIIEQVSKAPGVTRKAAIEVVAELSRVNELGAGLFQGLSRSVADYARITGTDAPTAAKTLAQIFGGDIAQGAKQLEDRLGTLSSGVLLTVQRLADAGDRVGAANALFTEFQRVTAGVADNGLTPLKKAANDLGNAWDKTMGAFRESEGLTNANAKLSNLLATVAHGIERLPELEQRARSAFKGTLFGLIVDTTFAAPKHTGSVSGDFEGPNTGSVTGSFAAAAAQVEVQSNDKRIKSVLAVTESYKTQASEIVKLTGLQKAARETLALAAPGSDQAKALQDRIAGIGERITSLRKRGGGGDGDVDRDLKRATSATIDLARRQADTIKSQVAAQNEDLRAQYDAGEIDLASYYRRRVELTQEGAAAEQTAIEKAIAARTRESQVGRKEETRADAAEKLPALREQAVKAGADAERNRTKVAQEGKALESQLTRLLIDQQIELAQISGDAFTAETLRNEQRVAQIKVVADQKFGRGTPEADDAVNRFQTLLRLQADSNELQRQSQALSQRSAIEEERFLIAAKAGAATREQTERGLFEIRSRAIAQLAEQVRQADAQVAALGSAATPDSPAVQFARQLRLELERLSQTVDPALERLRAVGDEVADAFGRTAGAIALNAKDARSAVFSLVQSLGQIAVRETVERPITDFIRQKISGVVEPGQGGGIGEAIRGIFNVSAKAPATNGFSLDGAFGGNVNALSTGEGLVATPGRFDGTFGGFLNGVFGGAAQLPGLGGTGGAGGARGGALPAASASAAASLNQLARVAGGGAAAGPGGTAAGVLEGVFSAFDTSGAGTTSTPTAERDILRRTEAGITDDVITPLGEAVDGVLPRFGDLGKGLLAAGEGLQGLPQLLQSILSSLSSSGGSQASGLGSIFSSIVGGSGSSGGLDGIGNLFISLFGLAEGGAIHGPGTATSDSIPILASDGEFMVRARAAQQPGAAEFLARFNAIGMPAVNDTFLSRVQASAGRPGQIAMPRGFADGGYVSNAMAMAADYAGYAAGGMVESMAERTPMQRRELAAPVSGPRDVTVNNTFKVEGQVDRRTESQIAAAAGRSIQRALNRGH